MGFVKENALHISETVVNEKGQRLCGVHYFPVYDRRRINRNMRFGCQMCADNAENDFWETLHESIRAITPKANRPAKTEQPAEAEQPDKDWAFAINGKKYRLNENGKYERIQSEAAAIAEIRATHTQTADAPKPPIVWISGSEYKLNSNGGYDPTGKKRNHLPSGAGLY